MPVYIMFGNRLVFTLLLWSLAATGQDAPALKPTWTASLTGGFASTFQMTLGGTYGDGPAFQNRLTVSLNNAFRGGDSISAFGWSTTDLPTRAPNWQAGLLYKALVMHRKAGTITMTGGVQRWVLPAIKTGAKDWLFSGNLTYGTKVKRVPPFVTADSYSLLESTLPTGTVVYTQVYTEHRLLSRDGLRVMLRQGPAFTHSWGFYGAEGNRVFRYGGALLLSTKHATLEGGFRQQAALQDKIPDNRYWYVLLTRQLTR
jgi:hypothetical protein